MIKPTAANNHGLGWNYLFEDGSEFWFLGLSKRELKAEEKRHGKLLEKSPVRKTIWQGSRDER